MKLVFGLVGVTLMVVFLYSFVAKVKEPAMIAVVLIGVAMMLIDAWQARDEADT